MENENVPVPAPEQQIINNTPVKSNYYTSFGKKAWDFCMGFLGYITLNVLFSFVFNSLVITFPYIFYVSLAVLVGFGILFFRIGRRFIAIGALSVFLIPLLLFGACMIMFSAGGGF